MNILLLDRPVRPVCVCHGVPQAWQKRTDRPSGGGWKCTVLATEAQKRYRTRHPEDARARTREWHRANLPKLRVYQREHKYGLTAEAFDAFVAAQGGACAICREPLSTEPRRLAVDHDHRTGVVRGVLCHGCNIALGWYERPGFAERVGPYLDRTR